MKNERLFREMRDADAMRAANTEQRGARGMLTEYGVGVMEGLRALWGDLKERPVETLWSGVADVHRQGGNIWDSLRESVGEAIGDIRKKVVEEGYFGREVSPKEMEVTHHAAGGIAEAGEPSPKMGFAELMAAQSALQPQATAQADRDRQTPEPPPPDMMDR